MTRPEVQEQDEALMRTGFIHLSFSVGNRETVDELTSRLESEGMS